MPTFIDLLWRQMMLDSRAAGNLTAPVESAQYPRDTIADEYESDAVFFWLGQTGRITARTVTITDAWGHKHVVGGFGDVG